MTRDQNGAVTFWVTNRGAHYIVGNIFHYTLYWLINVILQFPDRWQGNEVAPKSAVAPKNWESTDLPMLYSTDEQGNPVFNFYQSDPIVQPYPDEENNYNEDEYSSDESEEEEQDPLKDLHNIFFVFNHQNIWANTQILDPSVSYLFFVTHVSKLRVLT